MTLYLDTSALVKLYIEEADSALVEELVAQATVIATAVIAFAEVRATFARFLRERRWKAEDLAEAKAALDADWRHFVRFTVDEDLAQAAGKLTELHPLRGYDATHLAAAQRAARHLGGPLVIATFDRDLQAAAAVEKIRVNGQ